MSKKKFLKIGLMAFIFAFSLFISGVGAEEEVETDCQGVGQIVTADQNYPAGWCIKDPYMEYDNDNSADDVSPGGDPVSVSIIGNNAPFTWTISGNGFFFNSEYTLTTISDTHSKSVSVYARSDACGTATITITGCDGEEVKGYVRCTAGTWSTETYTCGSNYGNQTSGYCSVIIGKYRYTDKKGCVNCSGPICSMLFDSYDYCFNADPAGDYGCTNDCSSTYCYGICKIACTGNAREEWICGQ